MRSRTELVTTTFVDSEEEVSDDDDSGEDWRPSASNRSGGRRQRQILARRGRKRRAAGVGRVPVKVPSNKPNMDSEGPSDQEANCHNDESESPEPEATTSKAVRTTAQQVKKQRREENTESSTPSTSNSSNDVLDLLLYKKDLTGDFLKNSRLCLWRRDDNNLLQKYIWVKTSPPEEFLFTSSSVYSSWDDKRMSDFTTVKVKCMDPGNRRVKIINVSDIQRLALEESEKKSTKDDNGKHDEETKESENSEESAGSKEENGDNNYDDENADDDELDEPVAKKPKRGFSQVLLKKESNQFTDKTNAFDNDENIYNESDEKIDDQNECKIEDENDDEIEEYNDDHDNDGERAACAEDAAEIAEGDENVDGDNSSEVDGDNAIGRAD